MEEQTVVYTDGSMKEGGVDSAFVSEGASHSGHWPKAANVYTAELYAVGEAVRFCEHRRKRKFFICMDSLNFLPTLDNPGIMDP